MDQCGKIEGFMPLILVTNDDGVTSEGIRALADAVRPLGEVIVVAPLQEASAIGHALTLRRPLRIENISEGVYGVDGTPTDCVNLACAIILKRVPDLVVSGINKGWNLGDDITYSGTVSGALEGALLGTPGIGVSLKRTPAYDFGPSAAAAGKVAAAVLRHGLPQRCFININVPAGTPKGMRVTTQAKRNHVTKIDARMDPRGNAYYWIEEALDEYHPDSGRTDYEAVKEGYISVTPLQPDMTAYEVLAPLVEHLK
jgi:5'-nucleotidase